MAADQGLEGQLVAMGDVPFQEPDVGEPRQGPLVEEAVDLPQGGIASHAGHDFVPLWFAVPSVYLGPAPWGPHNQAAISCPTIPLRAPG